MKLRITKWRIACAAILLPLLHALSAGPAFYIADHFTGTREIIVPLYTPVVYLICHTPLGDAYWNYLEWCSPWQIVP